MGSTKYNFPVFGCVSLFWNVGDPTLVSSISLVLLFVLLLGWKMREVFFWGFVSPMFEVSKKNTDMVKLLNRQGSEEESASKDESAALLIAVHSSDNNRMPSKPISLPTESEAC